MAESGAVSRGGFFRKLNRRYLDLPFYYRLPLAFAVFCLIIVSIQNPLVFPGAVISLFFGSSSRDPATIPMGVRSERVATADGESLELWRCGKILPAGNRAPLAVRFAR